MWLHVSFSRTLVSGWTYYRCMSVMSAVILAYRFLKLYEAFVAMAYDEIKPS